MADIVPHLHHAGVFVAFHIDIYEESIGRVFKRDYCMGDAGSYGIRPISDVAKVGRCVAVGMCGLNGRFGDHSVAVGRHELHFTRQFLVRNSDVSGGVAKSELIQTAVLPYHKGEFKIVGDYLQLLLLRSECHSRQEDSRSHHIQYTMFHFNIYSLVL